MFFRGKLKQPAFSEFASSSAAMYKPETASGKKRPPPVKLLSGQLRTAYKRGSDGYDVRLGKGRTLAVSLVWMQGTVLEVQLELSTVLLMDETGTFVVQGVNSIPKGKPCLSQGQSATLRHLYVLFGI